MVKILFLDDDPVRHGLCHLFEARFESQIDITYVWDAKQAKHAINKEKFEVYCLDHDLGEFGVSAEENSDSGYDVAKFIAENVVPNKQLIFIHSWNVYGADNMANALKAFNIIREPFGSRFFSFLGEYISKRGSL